MSLTSSNMLPLGTQAPEFSLQNTVDRNQIDLYTHVNKHPFVIAFICNHCPYVIHIIDKFVEVANTYEQKGIKHIAISANDVVSHPADSSDHMKSLAEQKGFVFPYCYDESQKIAKAYDAACTPDFYLFNQDKLLVYRGQFDSSRPNNEIPVTGKSLINAMNNSLNNKPIDQQQTQSMGCNIKWKAAV